MSVRHWVGAGAVAALICAAPHAPARAGEAAADGQLPVYKAMPGVAGSIKSVGSDTMNNLMTLWGEGFRKFYPSVVMEVEGKGSSTAPPALVEGTCAFGPMSREMKEKEVDAFQQRYGYAPTALPTSIDMLAVYVHHDNPIKGFTLQQLDAIFSSTRKSGAAAQIHTWGELGLTGEWADKPISLYGRNAASGTYGYFKDHALFGGDYLPSVKELPGSSSVVQGVSSDRYAIGYSGIGYKTAGVRAVPLAEAPNSPFVEAELQHAYTGDYPLARFLLLYVNRKPNTELDPLRREFIRYVYSRQGQSDVTKDGFFPVTTTMAKEALEAAGIHSGI